MSSSHYLTTPRAWIFQLTGLVGIANGGLTSYALKTYTTKTTQVAAQGAKLSSSAISAAGGISITAGALAGTFTGLLFMAMLFRPGHGESRRTVLIKEGLAGVFTLLFLVAALLSTVVIATGHYGLDTTGLSPATRAAIISSIGGLDYRSSKPTIAYTVGDWICCVMMGLCTFVMSRAARHVLAEGPAQGVPKAFPERFAEPYLDKAFPKTFQSGAEVSQVSPL
ncbi:hypothetical protein RQP46_005018 [Phenoliferia psychrophenolica]